MICKVWLKSEGKMRTLWTLNHFWTKHESFFLKLEDWNWFGRKEMIYWLWPKSEGKMGTLWSLNHFSNVDQNAMKRERAWTWIANFWLILFVLRAESFSSFCTKFNVKCFLCKTSIRIVCKTLLYFVQIDWPNFFGLFTSSYQGNKVTLEFRFHLKVDLAAAEAAKLIILNRM